MRFTCDFRWLSACLFIGRTFYPVGRINDRTVHYQSYGYCLPFISLCFSLRRLA